MVLIYADYLKNSISTESRMEFTLLDLRECSICLFLKVYYPASVNINHPVSYLSFSLKVYYPASVNINHLVSYLSFSNDFLKLKKLKKYFHTKNL